MVKNIIEKIDNKSRYQILKLPLGKLFILIKLMSQGQLLETHLLESRLLDTFFRNLDCSTEKCHLLDKKKYAVRVPHVNFEQLIKKVQLLKILSR
jgi:hypothetical protein